MSDPRKDFKLIDRETGREILPGEAVTNFRGETETFEMISRVPTPGKTGKVVLDGIERYPTVIDAVIVPSETENDNV